MSKLDCIGVTIQCECTSENGAAEDGGDRADVQINMSFEHYEALRRKISLKMRKGSKSDLNALERFIYLPIAKAS